jgi:PAS domain S-box-containing protein
MEEKTVGTHDATMSVRRTNELQMGDIMFRTLAEHLPQVITRFDKNLRHTYINNSIESITGLRPEGFIGRTNEEMGFPSETVMQWNAALRHVFATGEEAGISFTFDGPAGPRDFVSLLVPERGVDGEIATVLGVIRDVTQQKKSETQYEDSRRKMRNLAVHLLHAREEERKKVAREIHDELGQILLALKMDIQWIEKRLDPAPPQLRDKIQATIELADQTIKIVHRIASDLRPGILDDLGLAAAIDWLAADFARRNGIPCHVDFTAQMARLGGNSSTTLFRIIQEGLSNVALHAQASIASVEIWEAEGALVLRIHDDGHGITEEQAGSPLSLGLIGIRERVQELGGAMTILGKPGNGTTLTVTIPLPAEGGLA